MSLSLHKVFLSMLLGSALDMLPKTKRVKKPIYIWRCLQCGKKQKSRDSEYNGLPCGKCGNDNRNMFRLILSKKPKCKVEDL